MFSYFEDPSKFMKFKICLWDGEDIWISTREISQEMISDIKHNTGVDINEHKAYFNYLNPHKVVDEEKIKEILLKMDDKSLRDKIIISYRNNRIHRILNDSY